MKRLDVFFNPDDLQRFLSFLVQNHIKLYSENGKRIQEDVQGKMRLDEFYAFPPSENTDNQYTKYDLSECYSNGDCVCVFLNGLSEYGLHTPGSISCSDKNGKASRTYKLMIRYIREHFHKVSNSTYYIGPQMYSKWLTRSISFHFFVDVQSFSISKKFSPVSKILEEVKQLGYHVLADQCDIRKQMPEECAQSFIIFSDNAKLFTTIRSRILSYTPDSEGAFLIRSESYETWKIVMDNRFFKSPTGMRMYQELKSRLCCDVNFVT